MLQKENRLKNSRDIQKVFKYGKSTRSGFLFLKFLENKQEATRVAFAVGTSYSPSAARRNRLKRILRDLFKKEIPKIQTGLDLVVGPTISEPEKIDRKKIKEDLGLLLKSANLHT